MSNKSINHFDSEGTLVKLPSEKEDIKTAKILEKYLKGNIEIYSKLSEVVQETVEYYTNSYAKESIESLLFSEDISLEEMSELLNISEDILNEYAFWFCDLNKLNTFFRRKMFLETKIEQLKDLLSKSNSEKIIMELRSYLFKKWSLMLGKEFVIWKFGLKKIEVTTSNFLNILYKEAFFYYKEISMSEKDVEYQEYTKILGALVRSIKDINSAMMQNGASDNLILDIQEALDIVIVGEDNPENNSVKQLTGDVICNSKIS